MTDLMYGHANEIKSAVRDAIRWIKIKAEVFVPAKGQKAEM